MTALLPGPPPMESLVPHRDPALLVRVVASSSPGEICCIAVISGDHPLAADGRAPCLLGIEAAAQAAAALEALSRPPEESAGPRVGYLVGVREAVFHLPDLPAGWPLRIAVRAAGSAPPLAVYEATVELDGVPALTATLSTYLATETSEPSEPAEPSEP
jgi:predicted hotdog family 3-hydroxylacyl-ACP dehydratase